MKPPKIYEIWIIDDVRDNKVKKVKVLEIIKHPDYKFNWELNTYRISTIKTPDIIFSLPGTKLIAEIIR